jgi:hypothetical protein
MEFILSTNTALQEVNAQGKRVIFRTENYANYHPGFNSLLRNCKLLDMLDQLAGEEMFLFKEKINYKLAGSGGFYTASRLDGVYAHQGYQTSEDPSGA